MGEAPEEKIVVDARTVLDKEAAALIEPDHCVEFEAWRQKRANWTNDMAAWRALPEANRGPQPSGPPPPPAFMSAFSALCLSGGGIRSAAFCLGVIQAFAARKLLKQFHYLSTVSGGGYIGGWLTRCIAAWKGDVAKVETQLNVYQQVSADGALNRRDRVEPPELRRLRRYTNFLTPNPGLASVDTWAGIMLWLRNTLINWAVFSPMFLAVAALPMLYYALICLAGSADPGSGWFWGVSGVLSVVSLLCIGIANHQICINMPTHGELDYEGIESGDRGFGLSGANITKRIGRFSLAWTFLAPLALAPVLSPPQAAFGVHAAFFGVEKTPAPDCVPATDNASSIKAESPAPSPPAVIKIPRLSALLPAGLRPYASVPFLRERTAHCVLPIMLFLTYLFAFMAAWIRVRWRFRNVRRSARRAYRSAARASREACRKANETLARGDTAEAAEAAKAKTIAAAKAMEKRYEWRQARERPNAFLDENMRAFRSNIVAWTISGAIGAVLLLIGMWLDFGRDALWLALAGPLWITGVEFVRSAAYVAIRQSGIYTDLDREWLARISGAKFRFVAGACAIGTAAVFLPRLVFDQYSTTYTSLGALITLFGGGTITAFLGQSARTVFTHGVKSADDSSFWSIDRLIMFAAALLGILIFVVAGRADILVAYGLDTVVFAPPYETEGFTGSPGINQFLRIADFLLLSYAIFASFTIIVDCAVNLNRFSMHAVYRNRIIRAFLGTALAWFPAFAPSDELAQHERERVPNRYTGFGAADNMRMANAFPAKTDAQAQRKLFPVINTTLNRTSGKDTARAARKGAPFTITPLHCGSPSLKKWQGAYVPTKYYAGGDRETGMDDEQNGISLGTAMAISGAAVSPNMGYNSSPFTALLMTLFNLRLGAWLPNPAARKVEKITANQEMKQDEKAKQQKDFFKRAGPLRAVPSLLQELTGKSDDAGDYIYLSDGGHFDNLGLYEMLRRRCGYIVVVDAGADKDYKYFDLGHTLEMASIDLGVKISFSRPLACNKKKLSLTAAYAAITYPADILAGLPGATGQLIYIKPWLPAEAPIELLSYKQVKPNFPHEPTEDQFFTESDFESYRRLGEFVVNTMLTKLLTKKLLTKELDEDKLASLFDQAARQPKPDHAPAAPNPKKPTPTPAKQSTCG